MSSKIGVQNIAHTNGTVAATIASNGNVGIKGHVLQIIVGTGTGDTTTTSTNYVDSNVTATITPTLATSKIIVQLNGQMYVFGGVADSGVKMQLLRGSTVVGHEIQAYSAGGSSMEWAGAVTMCIQDSPNTTSTITYKMQHKCFVGGSGSFRGSRSTITLMEIGG